MDSSHQIINLIPVPTFLIDKNSFKIVDYNEKAKILTQLNEEEIKNSKISDFIATDFIKIGEFEKCSFRINGQNCLIGNLTIKALDKENLIVSFWSNHKIDRELNKTTENKGVKENINFTKALIDLSTDSVFIMQNGIIRYANPNLLKVSGYKLSELVGIKFTEFVSPKELEKVLSLFENRQKGKIAPTKYESSAKLRNGKSIDVEVSVANLIFEDKPSFQVVLRDVTKQKIAERKYRNIVDFAPIGFYQTSRIGDFLLVNNEMATILGFENNVSLISRNISEFYYSTEEREKLIEKYDKAKKSEVKNVEVKFKKKDGSLIWVLMTARAIKDDNKNTLGYDGFIIDISGRKKKESLQKLMLNLSKKSFLNISLKEYLELIHKELKQIMKADNFYVALYNKITDKYTFPYSVDPFDDDNYDSPMYLHNSLTNMVRETKQGRMVNKKTINELHEKHQLKIYDEISAVWLGVPLIDSSNDEAIGVLALQDYTDEKAYSEDDLQTLEIIAGNAGLFVERIKNQEKLRLAKILAEEGERRYKSLFNDNNSVMLLVDPKTGNIVDANKSACDFYGYLHQQLIALKIQQINTLSAKEVEDEMQEALNEGRGHFNFKHQLANSEIRDVEVYSGKVSISGDVLLYSIVHDVTERKLAEEKVLKLSTSIEQSPISIIITDLNGAIEYVNPYYAEISGYDFDELIGHNANILSSGVQNKIFYKELWDTILVGDKWQGEMCNKKKNGELFWERAIISPIKNQEGVVTHFVGIKEDITEKIETEKKLRFLADSLEQVGECVSITDKDDIILYVNESFCKTYQYAKSELLGKHIGILQPEEITQDQVNDILSNTKKGGWKGELINKRKDGSLLPILLSTSVIEDDEHLQIAFVGIAMDITEIKKNRNELIAAKDRAEESDRLKSAFLATMSHELRTPLNAIIGFSDLISEEMTLDENLGFAKTIHKSGNHLLNIVEDIFDISLIESGHINIKNSQVILLDLLNEVLEVAKAEQKVLAKSNIRLNLVLSSAKEDILLWTDPSKLKQILINLLKNALKFTHEGHINFGYRIEKNKNSQCVRFFVTDTGIGMDKNKKELIFEKFRQADDSHTRIYGGTGIGLSISKKLTELMGGKIWVDSELGKGSTFYFMIPVGAIEPEALDSNSSNNKVINYNTNKVLIVEDDDSSYEFLKIILENKGINIIRAPNGKDAIRLCKLKKDISIVLMDVNMPELNGYEATKKIKKLRPKLPVIAQTAYALSGDKEKALKAGCDDYITKPINKNELYHLIEKYS